MDPQPIPNQSRYRNRPFEVCGGLDHRDWLPCEIFVRYSKFFLGKIFPGRNSSRAKRLIMVPDSALECREKLELCKKTYLNTPSESITL